MENVLDKKYDLFRRQLFGEVKSTRKIKSDMTTLSNEECMKLYSSVIDKDRRLSNISQELENFVYIASHDLTEPVRSVKSYLELVKVKCAGQLNDEAKKFIDCAEKEAKRAQQMIDDLLCYSRLSTRSESFGSIDSKAALDFAISKFSNEIRERHALILTDNDYPTIWGDKVQIVQLFSELIANALKFQYPDNIPEIVIKSTESDTHWIFSVHDNGIGIKAKEQVKIFEPFKRLHSRAEYPGSGIGLANCKKIVALHEGTIWLDSIPGKGSTFFFSIKKTQNKHHD